MGERSVLAARISAEEGQWDTCALKRTDFKRTRPNHQLHLKLEVSEALKLLAETASGGELTMFSDITVDEVSLDDSLQQLELVAHCDAGQLGSTGQAVNIIVSGEDRVNDEPACTLTFSRFGGDIMSFRTILLALKSNVNISLHTDV